MSKPPFLVLMKGFPATGKSALAHALSRRTAWPLIDKDDVKDFTLQLEDGNALAYEIMWSVTRRQLQMGLSVIVDSPLTYPQAYATGSALANEFDAQLLVTEVQLDQNTWRERLERRDRSQSKHKIAGWDDMQAMLRQYNGCWQYPIALGSHLVVDATRPIEELLSLVMERLCALADKRDDSE